MQKAWQATKAFCKRADMLLLGLCVLCSLFGIVIIRSATLSYDDSSRFVFVQMCVLCSLFGIVIIRSATLSYDDSSRFVFVQILSLFLGIALFVIFTILDAENIADKWQYLMVFNVIFLLMLIPFGVDAGTGNKSWLRFFGIGIQPSEVVKVIFIIILAKQLSYLQKYKDLSF